MQTYKKYTIPLILISLVLCISYLSYYNYTTQKKLLLKQVQSNSLNIVSSVSSAIERFHDVKSTMNLQKLVDDVSFGLDIFEFRYLEADGIIRNSMFKEEIGTVLTSKSFIETLQGERRISSFFFEVRDYVDVMSIYYPIYSNNKLIGIIDLAVDMSEYDLTKSLINNAAILHRQTDILNLLKAINGSITNSITILNKTDINDFLHAYIDTAKDIKQISIVNNEDKIFISSSKYLIGKKLTDEDSPKPGMNMIDGELTYLTVVNSHLFDDNYLTKLMLLTDATNYAHHEKQLLTTALITSIIALLFALFTSRLIYYTAIEQSRKERERLEELVSIRTKEIELLSKTDELTGLWNRRYLEESLDTEFKRAKRYNHDISIMMIDLDHFKHINDTYGHMAGDEVLRQMSSRIKGCQRETDFVARYGGEEIVVILPETDIKTATEIADTILKSIAKEPVLFESFTIEVTTSIGISNMSPEHLNYSMIFAEADEALYSAKANGRNRVEVYNKKI